MAHEHHSEYQDFTDQELIAVYRDGDDAAFDQLIERYVPMVQNFVTRLAGNLPGDDVLDIVQETFLKAWKNFKKYDDKHLFKTWLLTIARNSLIDMFRKKKPMLFSSLDRTSADAEDVQDFGSQIPDDQLLPDQVFEQAELQTKLARLMDDLSIDARTIILLHHVDELSLSEVSEVLKKPLNTVKSIYRRALLQLRKRLSAPDAPESALNPYK